MNYLNDDKCSYYVRKVKYSDILTMSRCRRTTFVTRYYMSLDNSNKIPRGASNVSSVLEIHKTKEGIKNRDEYRVEITF